MLLYNSVSLSKVMTVRLAQPLRIEASSPWRRWAVGCSQESVLQVRERAVPMRLSRVPGCLLYTAQPCYLATQVPPPHPTPIPLPRSPGRATNKWCSASWRCLCHLLGGFRGSSRDLEGAGQRKSLRVPTQRKRSRWGRGCPLWDPRVSVGRLCPAVWMPHSGFPG